MDSKITKKRLSNFLAYEWILMIIAVFAAIVVMEFIYSVSATRITAGQYFKYYLDKNLSSDVADFYQTLNYEQNKNGTTFSYDVLKVDVESLVASDDILTVRLSVQEGDVIFTDKTEEENGSSRAKAIVDAYPVMTMDDLLNSAKEYLAGFKVNGELSEDLIRAHFDERMKRDNRFRTEEQKEAGRILEIGRIEKLAKETEDFEKLFTADMDGLFFCYTKYELSHELNPDGKDWEVLYGREKDAGRENLKYGINLSVLSYEGDGKKDVSRFFQRYDTGTADDVVIMVFDFTEYQPDLQFETISFINTIFRSCSDILD